MFKKKKKKKKKKKIKKKKKKKKVKSMLNGYSICRTYIFYKLNEGKLHSWREINLENNVFYIKLKLIIMM